VTLISPSAPETHSPDLLPRARSGDARAFCELCACYEVRLIRHAMSLCRDAQMAEDLARETFVEAWNHLARYREEARFFTWLCAILLNRYRNSIRRQRPFPFSILSFEDRDALENTVDTSDAPSDTAEKNDRAALVARTLKKLSPKHREVIFLRFFVDDSLESIAAAIGCSLGTAKSRLFYALEALRGMEELKEENL
jgi:RNA polymerase sigma-70 factor (ECF subfamily)